jgi:hypothetical protein
MKAWRVAASARRSAGRSWKAADTAKFVSGSSVKETGPGVYAASFFPEALGKRTCPCLKSLDEAMPITYCYRRGGHVRFRLETALGEKGCRFELRLLQPSTVPRGVPVEAIGRSLITIYYLLRPIP